MKGHNKPGAGRPEIFDLERAKAMLAEGKTYAEIAAALNMKSVNYVQQRLDGKGKYRSQLLLRAKALDCRVEKIDYEIFSIGQALRSLRLDREEYVSELKQADAAGRPRKSVRAFGRAPLDRISNRIAEAEMSLEELRKALDIEVVLINRIETESAQATELDLVSFGVEPTKSETVQP